MHGYGLAGGRDTFNRVGEQHASHTLAGRVIPLAFGPQPARRRRGQKRPDHREAQPRPPVVPAASIVAVLPGIPPWLCRGEADLKRPTRS